METLERKNRLRSERMIRKISECTAAGMPANEAIGLSMREEGLLVPVFGLRSEEAITKEEANELHSQLESLLVTIQELTESAWSSSNE